MPPGMCSETSFEKTAAQGYTFKASCVSRGAEPCAIEVRIAGNIASHYTIDMSQVSQKTKGQRFEGMTVVAERRGECEGRR